MTKVLQEKLKNFPKYVPVDELDQKLLGVLSKLSKDGVDIKIREFYCGNHDIIIKTKNYRLTMGANDLGVWLKSLNKVQKK